MKARAEGSGPAVPATGPSARGRRASEKTGGKKGAAAPGTHGTAAPRRLDTSSRSHCFRIGRRYEITTIDGSLRGELLAVSDTQLRLRRLHARSGRVHLVALADILRVEELS